MLDINKLIRAQTLPRCEAGEMLADLDHWDEDIARDQARHEGLDLEDPHLEVLCWLREQHEACGPAPNARALLRALEAAFSGEGGRRYLYTLFPRGPVSQGCRLAGLPIPAGNADPSFGTCH